MTRVIGALATLVMLAGLVFLVARAPKTLAKRVWLLTFAIIFGGGVTMMVAHSFIAKWAFRGNGRAGLIKLMDGTAERPFVYRRLAPNIVRVATDFALPRLPEKTIHYFEEESPLRRYRDLEGEDPWTTRKAVAFHVAYLLTWSAWFGAFIVGAAFQREVLKSSWLEALTTASLLMCLVPLTFVSGSYLYDGPELLLWTSTLLCAIRRQFWAVICLFALMLANKESAVLAVPALFPIFLNRYGVRRAILFGCTLAAMGCAWLVFVRTKYAAIQGSPMEFWLPLNTAFWLRPTSYFRFTDLFSPSLPSPRGANIISLLLLLFPVRFGWHSVPSEFRWATIIMMVELVPLFLVSSFKDEIRALSLVYPLILIPAIQGVRTMFNLAPAPPAPPH
jgi:hypothetical protein